MVPNGVTSIGDYSFRDTSSLTAITLPATVISIGDYAFLSAEELATVSFDSGSQLTSIGNNAFFNASSLTSFTIPASVSTIGDGAFSLTSLTAITIPPGVTAIANNTFANTPSLTEVNFANESQATSIGAAAFQGTALTSISIPSSVTSIGIYAFRNASRLTAINVAENNSSYASEDGVLFNKAKTLLIKFPDAKASSPYFIPATVTSIEEDSFQNANALISVTIPPGVTSIGSGAFQNANMLTTVSVPASVTTIGNHAFYGSSALSAINVAEANLNYSSEDGVLFNKARSILIKYPMGRSATSYSIPAGVAHIESYAFTDVAALSSVYFAGNAPTVGENGAFNYSGPSAYISETATGFGSEGSTWNGLTVVVVRPVALPAPAPPVPSATSTNSLAAQPDVLPAIAPVAPSQPTSKVKQRTAGASLATQIGMTVTPKAKVKLTVAKASRKICRVSGGRLVALKPGNCSVTVAVTPAKTKVVKKPKTAKQSTVVAIS